MLNFDALIDSARQSKWGLFKLNFLLRFHIPFNRPHGIRVIRITKNEVQTKIPNWRINQNHIRGIHACGLATAAEFAAGLLLLSRLEQKKYRLIMESLEAKYFFQAKSSATAVFKLEETLLQEKIIQALQEEEKVYHRCEVDLFDEANNHLCTVSTNWQIKSWDKVKTKIA